MLGARLIDVRAWYAIDGSTKHHQVRRYMTKRVRSVGKSRKDSAESDESGKSKRAAKTKPSGRGRSSTNPATSLTPSSPTPRDSDDIDSSDGGSGRLRIGDDWNAINIIALSQSNPLKAVAEFVENSIDAGAKNIVIVRGKEGGDLFLRISDDGKGIPLDENGIPNFKYVATHICDSIKRQLKSQGQKGLQGEFGIGLLSFWTVGERLSMISAARDGKSYEMRMERGVPTYRVLKTRRLLPEQGAELTIRPLLSGIRHFSGEKLQWYLASELRDRIRTAGVRIRIIDRQTRSEYPVEPRQFSGQLLHLPTPTATDSGETYVELYLADPSDERHIGLYRAGTRVLPSLTEIPEFDRHPWNSRYLEGLIDAPFLTISPGTRTGVIHDAALSKFIEALQPVEAALVQLIQQQEEAERERASQQTWRSIRRAFQEALLALPDDEYEWFRIADNRGRGKQDSGQPGLPLSGNASPTGEGAELGDAAEDDDQGEVEFFEHAGPLFSVKVTPSSTVVAVEQSKQLRAIPRDRSRRPVDKNLTYHWEIVEGGGTLSAIDDALVSYTAPPEPMLVRLRVTVTQDDVVCQGEALATVTDSLVADRRDSSDRRGLPSYTFQNAPGQLWRSRFDVEQNVILINNGHRDFVYASRNKTLQLRYICRLFAKELVVSNFPGQRPDQLLERMIELSMYTEENLR
jgi:hypothetical protein